jgi:CheY-like chemotaxis protein
MYTILLAEDNALNREMLSRRLERRGYRIIQVENGAEAIAQIQSTRPHLILMDLSMPVLDGWEATRRLKADPATRAIPIIALTAHAMIGDREKALAAGCDGFATKPVDLPKLLILIEDFQTKLSPAAPAAPAPAPARPAPAPVAAPAASTVTRNTLLVVDDNDLNREMLSRRLIKNGYQVVTAARGRDALEIIRRQEIDLVLLDIMMPEMNGLQVLAVIRETYTMLEMPVIMVTAKGQSDDMVTALKQGANDYVSKPIDFPVVLARIQTVLALRHNARGSVGDRAVAPPPSAPVVPALPHGPAPAPLSRSNPSSGSHRSSRPGAREDVSRGAQELAAGQLLGKCLLMEEIGRGSYGRVYRALHTSLKISVVVKILQANDHEALEAFKAEARILAQLNHPNIVRIMDFEDDAENPYVVLENVQGYSLAELIEQSGHVRLDRVLQIIFQTVAGLSAAQGIGIVHRDIKPGNILITRSGEAKVADLGLALLVNSADRSSTADGKAGSATTVGTAAYMAPEQARDSSQVDHRADIYSLGVTFYQAVTGQLPFTGKTANSVLLKHASEAPVPPHRLVPALDPAVSRVILRMLEKDPDDRHPTYAELQADLADLMGQDARQATPSSDPGSTTDRKLSKTTKTALSLRNLRDRLAEITLGKPKEEPPLH